MTLATALLVPALMAGCGSLGGGDPKLDYRTKAEALRPLDVPPELTPLPREDRFAIPDRPGAASAAQGQRGAPIAAAAVVAPSAPNARIERAGVQRWLAVDVPPEQAYAVVREFLPTVGLKIEREDPALGILETGWAENRAKLPQDLIRRTLGRVIDGVYSTGEQDKFRARIERTAKNTSEVYISHRGMVEVYANEAKDATRWQPRPADADLEAEMLQRLLLRFGGPVAPAATATAATTAPSRTPEVNVPPVTQVVASDSQARIDVAEPFDRAWRRVGLGLDRGGFTVEDRDRTKGLYFVRYLDPEYEAREREKQGFFSKVFGQEFKVEAQQFRILVQAAGDAQTRVSVQDRDGKPDNGATAAKIIKQLNDQLR